MLTAIECPTAIIPGTILTVLLSDVLTFVCALLIDGKTPIRGIHREAVIDAYALLRAST